MLSSIHYPRSGQKSERKKYYPGETTEDPFSVFIEHRLESATNVQKLQRSLELLRLISLKIKSSLFSLLPFGGLHKPFVTFVEALLLEVHTLGQVAETGEVNISLLLSKSDSFNMS